MSSRKSNALQGLSPESASANRSKATLAVTPPTPNDTDNRDDDSSDPELHRARSRSRSPQIIRQQSARSDRQVESGLTSATSPHDLFSPDTPNSPRRRNKPSGGPTADTKNVNSQNDRNRLSPNSALGPRLGMGSAYWRGLSRSPSPLGLIPIHREWRQFIHKHEIPRKALHVSIGFMVIFFYLRGYHVIDAAPILFKLLVPIFLTDVLRMRWPALNRFYIRVLGALMRESEAHDRYNGVISYMAGALFVALVCPDDVAIISLICLSWCDTAASTIGRIYGRYTPRVRKGKSLAGSIAAFSVGVISALLFWGLVADQVPPAAGQNSFAFQGQLKLPGLLGTLFGSTSHEGSRAILSGPMALFLLSLWTGLVVSVSEAIDIWGLDDNLTIPVLCGIALTIPLKVCT